MSSRATYTDEEKKQLLINLDIEVQHRTRQFRSWLEDQLEGFKIHQENTISRIPKPVRAMTMRDFGEKYHGNPVIAATGSQKEKLAAQVGDGLGEIDKTERKRKWMAIQETRDGDDGESSRNSKSARLTSYISPKKKGGTSTGPGTAQRARLLASGEKAPGRSRVPMDRIPDSPSPQKVKPPFTTSNAYITRPPSSPSKLPIHKLGQSRTRVPSTSSFNPVLPAKTPTYPRNAHHMHNTSATLRPPRKDEQMLSINGSPLANPFWADGLLPPDERHGGHTGEPHTLKRTQSNISIRRDPSFLSGLPPGAESQSSFYLGTSSKPHSRNNSDATLAESTTEPYNGLPKTSFETPYAPTKKYLVTISTKDGHILEFDPLQTSPKALDALEGITDSAKKQAREEMGRLVEAAVDKWKIR
ncbi:hypothetical protein J3R30DRAFT_3699681 [Lentinula aciculospora]|uniref:Borealin N-terminal domain-containing protein n=1 Tax=Lentinula aciculospora TaxID=153920 RepID=A0A9W9DSH9_9AGAR|nr:hypothetical protein J3R30DRAFT_3699681 [Lentinula aciculospora]